MAWTQTDVDTLKAAIATGARKVTYGSGPDRNEVEYQTFAAMTAALQMMEAEVNPTTPQPRVSYVSHCRF